MQLPLGVIFLFFFSFLLASLVYIIVVLLSTFHCFLQALLARERARAEFQDWEKKEEEVLYFYTLFLLNFKISVQCSCISYDVIIFVMPGDSSTLIKAK